MCVRQTGQHKEWYNICWCTACQLRDNGGGKGPANLHCDEQMALGMKILLGQHVRLGQVSLTSEQRRKQKKDLKKAGAGAKRTKVDIAEEPSGPYVQDKLAQPEQVIN